MKAGSGLLAPILADWRVVTALLLEGKVALPQARERLDAPASPGAAWLS